MSDYFQAKAAKAFAAAGGDPANAERLGEWAEAHRNDDSVHGVIVAEDGEIVAATWRDRAEGSGAVYVDQAGVKRWSLSGNEVGLATARITRLSGRRCVHIARSVVCFGADWGRH